ncbi:RNA helicase [Reticulomyxa filosa]|uniref:RNA helicase n=1 Tax=Reticulomyxa filosa TaxID=46433 RepID=X6NBD5_RETFI|nr:RNA helicase [Reticulomyxa filosa]|eukprot:ETO23316.1 RNA helicase [Reticulomyxa filosa]
MLSQKEKTKRKSKTNKNHSTAKVFSLIHLNPKWKKNAKQIIIKPLSFILVLEESKENTIKKKEASLHQWISKEKEVKKEKGKKVQTMNRFYDTYPHKLKNQFVFATHEKRRFHALLKKKKNKNKNKKN